MSIGIKIFGILAIIFSLLILLIVVIPDFVHTAHSYMFTFAYLITALCWMVFGIGVLKRLSWARIGLIVVAAIYIVDSVEYPSFMVAATKNHNMRALAVLILGLTFFVSVIVFFTRPSIKKHFDQNAKEPSLREGR